jgi:hypothetical protein
MADPVYELEMLAKWKPYTEGRALPLQGVQPGGGGGTKSGRPDYVDEHHEQLAAAIRARKTLELLRAAGEQGKKQADLLELTYVICSKEGRRAAAGSKARPGQDEARDFVGLLAAGAKTRERHRKVSGLDRENLRNRGARLLDEALAAYRSLRSAA